MNPLHGLPANYDDWRLSTPDDFEPESAEEECELCTTWDEVIVVSTLAEKAKAACRNHEYLCTDCVIRCVEDAEQDRGEAIMEERREREWEEER